ncbi:hypothetical protein GUJ93_ZPchr0004g40123 [Zizania palustris]|uniref:Secreted protein n=1 Tax=Zizania palustris TaxID=103762 RepID=A0A8J5VG00_ZIZPA|nr:hypothetical protein GUJ93_ZPchr0004g40123 [Zizania palustris]
MESGLVASHRLRLPSVAALAAAHLLLAAASRRGGLCPVRASTNGERKVGALERRVGDLRASSLQCPLPLLRSGKTLD